jgi:predicted nucleic acid-binding protein
MDAFDSDVLIYAASGTHPRGRALLALLNSDSLGSVMLLPEVLPKPIRDGRAADVAKLNELLARMHLVGVDHESARLAVVLGARYGLHAADAVHLATAVGAGADRFSTNNQKDFPKTISEIDVVYPADLTT